MRRPTAAAAAPQRAARRDINDEVGWLGFVGGRFGSFFVEGAYRNAKGTVKGDDIVNGVRRRADIDLDGPVVNAGWNWTF